MENKNNRKKRDHKDKPRSTAFIAYAILVFSTLAVGLIVILLRSKS